jgi:molecular chaperone DnaJ
MNVTFAQATLGAEVTVSTLDGQARLKIPAGTQPGARLRMRGKGFPHRMRTGRGDQLVEIHVEVPTRLSPRAKELLAALTTELAHTSSSAEQTLFGRLKKWL